MKILLLLILSLLSTAPVWSQPDTLFQHGNIYPGNEKQPRAEAVAVKNGRITFVGSDADASRLPAPATKIVDLHGNTVLPGLTDSHYHLSRVGEREINLNLEGITNLETFLARVQERVAQTTPGAWVTGRGWIETFWKGQAFPTRWDLDRISSNNPVFLVRADAHGAVANSLAIRLAGVNNTTPSPFGGEIMRDKKTGEPNGMFLDNAQQLITRLIPPPSPEEAERAILLAVQRSLRLGWTEVHIPGNDYTEVDLIKRLYREGKIKLRLYDAILGPSRDTERLLREGVQTNVADGRFTVRSIKVVLDGALGSKGAALLENYSDYDTAGFLKWKKEDLMPMFEQALREGVQVMTHAIGDRANREILNEYEEAFRAVPPEQRKIAQPRWRVEHAQILSPEDIPRFAQLGVIPSMQPSHAISDLHFAASRLGLKRLAGAYAWQSLIKAGSIIPGGSDAPVERGEPMIEFYAAVARKDLTGFSGEGWHPELAVTREQALNMFTKWAAYAAFEENDRGTLEPGKLADLTILSQDIMKIPESEIPKTKCLMTIINGEVVFIDSTLK